MVVKLWKIFMASVFVSSISGTKSMTSKPNIILIVTDDQDIVLHGMTPMEKTRRLLVDEGVTFANAFCTTPLCCPSRSSILTGLYQRHTRVWNNSDSGGCSSRQWQQGLENLSFARFLHDYGYRTFYAGKYLNQYGHKTAGGISHVPRGWDWWIGLVGNSVYYNYSLSVNGSRVEHADKEDDYLTDVLKGYALDFLKQRDITEGATGFLMAINPPSAHAPFTPAPKYMDKFNSTKALRTPNFNKVDKNKHWLLRLPPDRLTDKDIKWVDEVYRNRWRTLLSVDDMVGEIIKQLTDAKLIDNTYVILTSDNGFHMGQFSLPWDKRLPYETDIRIPFFMRGPGVPRKSVVPYPILTIDIAPTLLDMAKIKHATLMDGTSFLPYAKNPGDTFERSFLVEYKGESSEEKKDPDNCWKDPNLALCMPDVSCKCEDVKNNTYVCLRQLSNVEDSKLCQFMDDENFREIYNIKVDPYEMNNLRNLEDESVRRYETTLNCIANYTSNGVPKTTVSECFSELNT